MKVFYALLLLMSLIGKHTKASNIYDLSKDWEKSSTFYNENEAYCAINSISWLSGNVGYVIIKDGEIVAEKYRRGKDQDSLTQIYSATKSFTSLLLGRLSYEGLFTFNTTLGDIFADEVDWEGVDDAEEKKTINMEELLTFSSGLISDEDVDGEYDTLQKCLNDKYNPDLRGTFNYLASNHLLSRIIYRLSLYTPQEVATNSGIFAALGIDTADYKWDTFGDIEGSAYGLNTSPRSMAKLGQLYLQNGVFGDNALEFIPVDWVEESLKKKVSYSDPTFWNFDGYGYQWYNSDDKIFAALGLFGNDILVFSEENTVVAITRDESILNYFSLDGSTIFKSVINRNIGKLHSQKTCSGFEAPFTFISEIFSYLTTDFSFSATANNLLVGLDILVTTIG